MKKRTQWKLFLSLIALVLVAVCVVSPKIGLTRDLVSTDEPLTYEFKPTNPEAKEILSILKKMAKACIDQDLDSIAAYLHKDVTSINEKTKVVLSGKKKVIDNIETMFRKYAPGGATPLTAYDIKEPFIHVHGNEAIVTYVATATIGGNTPSILTSKINEVFVKDDGKWKSIHYRSHWDHGKVPSVLNQNIMKPVLNDKINPKNFKVLQGGIKVLILNLTELRALGHDLRRASRCLEEVRREVSRKELIVIAPASDMDPVFEESKDDFLAPREKLLRRDANQIATIINALGKSVDEYEEGSLRLVIRKDIQKEVQSIIDRWPARLKEARKHQNDLERLLKSPPYENKKILASITILKNDLRTLIKEYRAIVKSFKKAPK